jgi:hypothetical protein
VAREGLEALLVLLIVLHLVAVEDRLCQVAVEEPTFYFFKVMSSKVSFNWN